MKTTKRPTQLSASLREIIQFAKMDLAESYDKCLCAPCGSAFPKKYYPSLYISGQKKIDLPMKGRAVIEYKLRSRTTNQDDNGNVTESACVEVQSIDPQVEDTPKKKPGAATIMNTKQLHASMREIVEFAARTPNEEYVPRGPNQGTKVRRVVGALAGGALGAWAGRRVGTLAGVGAGAGIGVTAGRIARMRGATGHPEAVGALFGGIAGGKTGRVMGTGAGAALGGMVGYRLAKGSRQENPDGDSPRLRRNYGKVIR